MRVRTAHRGLHAQGLARPILNSFSGLARQAGTTRRPQERLALTHPTSCPARHRQANALAALHLWPRSPLASGESLRNVAADDDFGLPTTQHQLCCRVDRSTERAVP